VLQVVLNLSPGGTERLVVETVRRLRDRYRIAVCCLDEAGAWAEELRQEGIEVVALRRQPGFRPSLGRQIAALAARHDARVLHCHHYSPFVYGCVARLCNPRLRLLFTEHGRLNDGPPSRKRRLANAVLSRFPDRVCVVSEDLRRHMGAEGFPLDGVRVVTNGIDPTAPQGEAARRTARAMLGAGEDTFVIGTVGRLNPVKDLPTLVAAFARGNAFGRGARLAIVGDGEERETLAAHAAAVPGVTLLGHRSDARLLMAGFDAYVSSSIFEGISLTILEAMAAGLPVVATRVGGTPEVVVDGETGLLIPPRDPAALGAALTRLAADPTAARAMGRAGRARVCERFTLDRMVNQYATAYAELGAL